MKRVVLSAVVGLALVGGSAHAGGLKKVRDAIRDVLADACNEDRECRRVLRGLEELRDQLDEGGGRRRLKGAMRTLRDLADEADDRCSKQVRRGIKRAAEAMADAVDSGRDDDDDRYD